MDSITNVVIGVDLTRYQYLITRTSFPLKNMVTKSRHQLEN